MRKKNIFLYIIWVGIFLVYARTLMLDFALDDIFLIKNNTLLYTDPWKLLLGDLWAGDESVAQSSFFRPLFLLSVLCDLVVTKEPWMFHLQNVFWHVAASTMLYVLLSRWLTSVQGLLAIGIFAFHPLQSEVVIWISARNDSMAAFFAFLSLWIYCREKWSPLRSLLGIVCVMCALLSKESTIFLPVLVLFMAPQNKWHRFFESVSAIGMVIGIRKYLEISVISPSEAHWELFWNKITMILVGDFSRILMPWPLCATRPLAWDHISVLVMMMGVFFLGILIYLCRDRYGRIGVLSSILFFIPTLWPTMLNGMHGDRYLYIPIAGLAFAIARTIAWQRWMGCILLCWVVVIQQRIPNWNGDKALWGSMYEQKKSSFSAVSLAHILYNEKKYKEAALLYQEGYAAKIPYIAGCSSYVVSIFKITSPAVAIEAGDWALERGCSLSGIMGGVLGVSLVAEGKWEEASVMQQISPFDPTKRIELVRGVLALQEGDWSQYIEIRSSWSTVSNFDKQIGKLTKEELNIARLPLHLE